LVVGINIWLYRIVRISYRVIRIAYIVLEQLKTYYYSARI